MKLTNAPADLENVGFLIEDAEMLAEEEPWRAQPESEEPLWASVYGPAVLEQVMLAIIRAAPSWDGSSDAKRLAWAMEALMGTKSERKKPSIDDRIALAKMSEASQRNRIAKQEVSDTKLADEAKSLTEGLSTNAIVSRLVKAYKADRIQIEQRIANQDEIAASLERQSVIQIFEILEKLGVPFVDPGNPVKLPVKFLCRA